MADIRQFGRAKKWKPVQLRPADSVDKERCKARGYCDAEYEGRVTRKDGTRYTVKRCRDCGTKYRTLDLDKVRKLEDFG